MDLAHLSATSTLLMNWAGKPIWLVFPLIGTSSVSGPVGRLGMRVAIVREMQNPGGGPSSLPKAMTDQATDSSHPVT